MRNIRICWIVYPEVGVLENKDNFRVVLDSTGWIYVKYHGNNNSDTKINLKRIQIPSQWLFWDNTQYNKISAEPKTLDPAGVLM